MFSIKRMLLTELLIINTLTEYPFNVKLISLTFCLDSLSLDFSLIWLTINWNEVKDNSSGW